MYNYKLSTKLAMTIFLQKLYHFFINEKRYQK